MDVYEMIEKYNKKINPRLMSLLVKISKAIPYIQKKKQELLRKEFGAVSAELEESMKPYRHTTESVTRIPEKGRSRESILAEMKKLNKAEEKKWRDGFVSGAVYHGDKRHINFLNEVYAANSQSNPLHSDVWPSTVKYEAEVVAMTSNMLGAGKVGQGDIPGDSVCGVVTSGGTESILLAMKSYRDWARDKKGIKKPEMVVPETVHAAFDKAAQYFNIKMIKIPVGRDLRADVRATRKAITRRTIVIVGSAPSFPHGVVDPIEEMSELARKKGIGFHTDACLGGFILPWIEKLGYTVPPYDFRLPGVTSISADTHKYGYAAKGTSVILYRRPELRRYQFYKTSEWPGGLYFSPTFAGSRPGALSATCWASIISIGEKGYMEGARKIMETADKIKKGIEKIPEIHIMGDPLWVIAFGSDTLNIYQVMEQMTKMGWSLNGLHRPPCVHLCITLRHTGPGIAQRFIRDLRTAVNYVKKHPKEKGTMAPVYGLAATIPDRDMVTDMLDLYMDLLYKI